MKKNMCLLFCLTVLVSAGCSSANLVLDSRANTVPQEYAPMNKQKEKYGVVNYLNEGADFVIQARRKDAFKKMFESCDGKYIVINEGSNESNPIFSNAEKYFAVDVLDTC